MTVLQLNPAVATAQNFVPNDGADETFRWVVLFDSTNPAHTDASSACGTEISSITVNNSAS